MIQLTGCVAVVPIFHSKVDTIAACGDASKTRVSFELAFRFSGSYIEDLFDSAPVSPARAVGTPAALLANTLLSTPDIMQEMIPEQLADEELVARFRATAGSDAADQWINELFQRHYARVARWCFRFTGEREAAADLAQEIFLNVHRHLGSFQGRSKFSTWLYSIAKNECLNAAKARSVRPTEAGDDLLAELPDLLQSDPYVALERQSSAQLVRDLLNEALDATEKVVFTLHYGEDLSLEAITRLLGLQNASGAKAHIVSAKRKLSRSVQRWKARKERKGQVVEGNDVG